MSDYKIKYSATTVITCTLASLPTSATRTAGRESTEVDNTVNLYDDVLLSGQLTTGTAPTAGKQMDLWIYADDGNGLYPDVFDGTESVETVTSENVRNSALKLAASILVDAASNQTYYFRGISIAALFGGVMPRKWGVFVTHDTAVNLNATGGLHELRYTGITYQSV